MIFATDIYYIYVCHVQKFQKYVYSLAGQLVIVIIQNK